MNYTFTSATILLLLITDPIGNIPIFASALRTVKPARRPLVIVREILIAFLLLLTFMFIGAPFLRAMNLSELALQIGGGIILFLIALRMVFPPPRTDDPSIDTEPLIVPLAIPALAAPAPWLPCCCSSHNNRNNGWSGLPRCASRCWSVPWF